MRYRRQTATGDYSFGHNDADFLVDSPAAFGQAVETRLRLFLGEYFPDTTVGMPWQTKVLGFNTSAVYDAAIRDCIVGTIGFQSFASYSSVLNARTRMLTVYALVNSVFSNQPTPIVVSVPVSGFGIAGYSDRPYGG